MASFIQDAYRVQLEGFDGPLDLLLYLIRKDELDIYDIPIGSVTAQYLEYLDLMKLLDLDIAGDFIVMASTLTFIKSRMLLPVEARPNVDENDEENDPRFDLVRQLVEYKMFKDASEHLADLENSQVNVFSRSSEVVDFGEPQNFALDEVSVFDLMNAFGSILSSQKSEEKSDKIYLEKVTVAAQVLHISELFDSADCLTLTQVFNGIESRQKLVCTFLALLELIRRNELNFQQIDEFGEIEIYKFETQKVAV